MIESAEDLEQKLQVQMDRIQDTITKIRQNELPDISDMDKEVSELCLKIIHSNEETVKNLEPKMVNMINMLDELAVEIKEYQDRIGENGNS